MTGIIIPTRFKSQPQYTAPVDWRHPILNGVSASIIATGGHGGWQKNFGRGMDQPTFSGAFATRTTSQGRGIDFNGTDTYLDYGTRNIPYLEFTLLWGGVFDGFASFPGFVDCTVSGVDGWNIFQAGSDTLWFSANGYGGILSSSGWPTGTFVHGALRNKASVDTTWFMNGVSIATTSGTSPAAPTVSFRVGTQRAGGVAYLDGAITYFYLFDKYLSNTEIARIAFNPWQIFRPAARRLAYATTAAPTTAKFRSTLSVFGSRIGSRQAHR